MSSNLVWCGWPNTPFREWTEEERTTWARSMIGSRKKRLKRMHRIFQPDPSQGILKPDPQKMVEAVKEAEKLGYSRENPPSPYSYRYKVYDRDGWRCLACDAPSPLTLDHVVPRSKGGKDVMSNLQTLCQSCNENKGVDVIDYRNSGVQADNKIIFPKSILQGDPYHPIY